MLIIWLSSDGYVLVIICWSFDDHLLIILQRTDKSTNKQTVDHFMIICTLSENKQTNKGDWLSDNLLLIFWLSSDDLMIMLFIFWWSSVDHTQAMLFEKAMQFMQVMQCQLCIQCHLCNTHNAHCVYNAICATPCMLLNQPMPFMHTMPFV